MPLGSDCGEQTRARKSSKSAGEGRKVDVATQSKWYSRAIKPLDLVSPFVHLGRVPRNRRGAMSAERANPQSNCAKRLECGELAPAFEPPPPCDSASKLDALQTLRGSVHPARSAAGGWSCSPSVWPPPLLPPSSMSASQDGWRRCWRRGSLWREPDFLERSERKLLSKYGCE
jgi:hypothetical protein